MIPWLADVLRAAGLAVLELDGWKKRRTRPGFDPVGIVWHHTATSTAWSDTAVARLLRDGRPDLPGPLSQLGLQRDGTFVTIAAGRCNHNGFGTWGNDSIGIEAYNDGLGEPWPPAQLDAYHTGTAAICAHLGFNPATQVLAHRETDPTRKTDPAGIDMDAARVRVAEIIDPPSPPLPPTLELDGMFFAKQANTVEVFLFEDGRYTHMKKRGDVDEIAKAAGIHNIEAIVGMATWSVLTAGRTKYS
jgi:hypothetical protein